ncbi:MAG: RidA family protein [Bacteroidetes bacterium]|nr:RidA family protein [Bacteroidota bacterium]
MKRIIVTDKAPNAIGAYSQAVEANGILFISGQIALDPATMRVVEGGVREQAERVLQNISHILEAAGYTLFDVVKTSILMTDIGNFTEVNQVYNKYFAENRPARATYEVSRLPMGVMLEIEAIAIKTDAS